MTPEVFIAIIGPVVCYLLGFWNGWLVRRDRERTKGLR